MLLAPAAILTADPPSHRLRGVRAGGKEIDPALFRVRGRHLNLHQIPDRDHVPGASAYQPHVFFVKFKPVSWKAFQAD